MGPDSYRNKCPQTLKHIADKVGIKTQWINTEQDTQPPFNDDPRMCYEDLNEDGSYTVTTKTTDGVTIRRTHYDAAGKIVFDDKTPVPPKSYNLPQSQTYKDRLVRIENFLLRAINEKDPRQQLHMMKSAFYHLEKILNLKTVEREDVENNLITILKDLSTQYDIANIVDTAEEFDVSYKAFICDERENLNMNVSEDEKIQCDVFKSVLAYLII